MSTSRRELPTELLFAAGFLVAADVRVAAPLLPAIAADFGTSVGVAGLTVAVYTLSYAAGQLLYGRVGDRVGKLRVIRTVLLIFALGTGCCSIAPSLPVLLLLRLFTGVFAAGVIPMSLAHFGDTVPDYAARRRRIGLFLSAVISGQVLGQALGGVLAGLLSWRAIFLVLGAAGGLLAAAFWRYSVPPARTAPAARSLFGELFRSDRPLFLLTAVETFFFLGSFVFASSSLIETRGASYPLAGSLLALFAIGSLITSRALARFLAAVPDSPRIAGGLAVAAAGFGILALTPQAPLFGLAVLVLGIGFTLAHSTLQTRATEVSREARGTAVSLFAGVGNVGAALGTFAAGAVVDGFGYAELFGAAALGLIAVGAAAARWLQPRREGKPPPPGSAV